MSIRGITFEHHQGDCVLCFEPDPSKAKVLYDAKILELSVGRDSKGKRKPAYLVHFQGWNNSWDRIVPESLILADTESNRILKGTLASIAKKVSKNSTRKRKIENILHQAFPHKRRFDINCFDSESSGDEDIEPDETMTLSNVDEDSHCETDTESQNFVTTEEIDNNCERNSNASFERVSEDDDHSSSSSEEELEYRDVNITLSDSLKRKLEDDCVNVQCKKRMVRLPAEPNIISILEGYVKNFGANLVYAEKKHYPSRGERDRPPPTDKNIELCKQVANSLRVIFDFTLKPRLLYDVERDYFDRISESYELKESPPSDGPDIKDKVSLAAPLKVKTEPPDVVVKSENADATKNESTTATTSEPAAASRRTTRLRSAALKIQQLSASPRVEISPLTKHAPQFKRALCDVERPVLRPTALFIDSSGGSGDAPQTTGKRLTRQQAHALEAQQSRAPADDKHQPSTSSHKSDDNPDSDVIKDPRRPPLRRCSLRSRSHRQSTDDEEHTAFDSGNESGGCNANACNSASEQQKGMTSAAVSTGGCSNKSSTAYDTDECSLPSLVYQHGYRSKEAALDDIFSWRLVPSSLYDQRPVQPSLVCGAQHFVRLFVVLPELLTRMRIPDEQLKPILSHIELLLEYLSNSSDELMPQSAYVAS